MGETPQVENEELLDPVTTMNAGHSEEETNHKDADADDDAPDDVADDVAVVEPHPTHYDEILTILHAAPLVSTNDEGDVTYLEIPFVGREHVHLQSALGDGKETLVRLGVECQPCTPKLLRSFLERKPRILHLACHAADDCVYLEQGDGRGSACKVPLTDFQQWAAAAAAAAALELVVVADPDPHPLVQLFLDAGASRVVSCPVTRHKMDGAALLFCRTLYTGLANRATVRAAFDAARKSVQDSTLLNYTEGRQDLQKYQLLGKKSPSHHDVVLFPPTGGEEETTTAKAVLRATPTTRILPSPPPVFVGRQKEVHQLLSALKSARLVTVTGTTGTGAVCVVKTACQYMAQRRDEFDFELIWMPPRLLGPMDDLTLLSQRIFEGIVQLQAPHDEDLRRLVELYKRYSVLVVYDIRKFESSSVFYELMDFLDEMLDITPRKKAIIIHNGADGLKDNSLQLSSSFVEKSLQVQPLGYSSTVTLFGMLCPHVAKRTVPSITSVDDLKKLMVPDAGYAGNVNLKMTIISIYNLLGQGSPNLIRDLALSMTTEEYENLIQVGRLRQKLSRLYQKQIEMAFPTRYSLDVHLSELSDAIEEARERKKYQDLEVFEAKFAEVGQRRKDLPSVDSMLITLKSLKTSHKLAQLSNNIKEADDMAAAIATLQKKIQRERRAMMEDDEDWIRINYVEYPRGISRRTLESRYRAKEHLLFDARKTRDFRLARELEFSVRELRDCRSLLLTAEEWNRKLMELDAQVKEEERNGDVDKVVKLHDMGDEIQKRLEDEEGAVDVARIADDLYLSLNAFLHYTGNEIVKGLPTFESLSSRVKIDQCLTQIKLKAASTAEDFDEERENTFIGLYKELCDLITTRFPSIESLLIERQVLKLEEKLVFSDDQEIIEAYEVELEDIEVRVADERRALGAHEFYGVSKAFYHQGITRSLVDRQIKTLEKALEQADDKGQLFDVAELEVKLAELTKHRDKLPTAKELDILIDKTEEDLAELTKRKGNESKKIMMGRAIIDLKQRREAERNPMKRLQTDIADELIIDLDDYFHAPLSDHSYAELNDKNLSDDDDGSYSSEGSEERELSTVEEELSDEGGSLDDDQLFKD